MLNNPEMLEQLAVATPGLADDPVAMCKYSTLFYVLFGSNNICTCIPLQRNLSWLTPSNRALSPPLRNL